jgi:hypothetical protein
LATLLNLRGLGFIHHSKVRMMMGHLTNYGQNVES